MDFLVAFLTALLGASAALPTKVIIDTDIGTDIDDQWSLAWMLSRPSDFDIQLIVTSTGNSTQRATTVAKFLTRVGRDSIPIAFGSNDTSCIYCQKWLGPLYRPAGYEYTNWAADFNLSSYRGDVHTDGTAAMAGAISNGATTIIAIAPTLTLAALAHKYPEAAGRCTVFFSGGSVYSGYHNSTRPSAEYNIEENTSASLVAFNARVFKTIYLLPLDVTEAAQVYGPKYLALKAAAAAGNILIATLLETYRAWAEAFGSELQTRELETPYPDFNSTVIYDVMPVALALQLRNVTTWLHVGTLQICVNRLGYTEVSTACGRSMQVALKWQTDSISQFQATIVDDLISWQDYQDAGLKRPPYLTV